MVGDSLTKEYQIEFPALFPSNPQAWLARNWVELLDTNRNAHFDLGSFSYFLGYPRIAGHKHNWAFPGATTQEIRNRIASTSSVDDDWQEEFRDQIEGEVERVVVFAGGNDVEDYYDDIYNGANARALTDVTEDNLTWIVDKIRQYKSTIPIVLVSVPHVGCSPKVQQSCPTHATKTARVTAALDGLNSRLASFAQRRGIGFTMEVYDLTKKLIYEPFYIGGVEFYRQGDMNSGLRYVYSGDNFHPNTCAHTRIAQSVINAFRTKYPSPNIPAATDVELLQWLTVNPALGFLEWLDEMDVPVGELDFSDDPDNDGLPNLVEFLLSGMDANENNFADIPRAIVQRITGQDMLTYSWLPSTQGLSFAPLTLLQSTNLSTWTVVPESSIVTNPDGSKTARLPATGPLFLRLTATK